MTTPSIANGILLRFFSIYSHALSMSSICVYVSRTECWNLPFLKLVKNCFMGLGRSLPIAYRQKTEGSLCGYLRSCCLMPAALRVFAKIFEFCFIAVWLSWEVTGIHNHLTTYFKVSWGALVGERIDFMVLILCVTSSPTSPSPLVKAIFGVL